MAHYADEVVFSSPYIKLLGIDNAGVIQGREQLGAYFGHALELVPDIHFDLVEIAVGVNSLVIVYRNHRGEFAAEMMAFEKDEVTSAAAHYAPRDPRA